MVSKETFCLVQTSDGTPTLFSEEYGQTMHTVDGAYSEAIIKHVVPSRIIEKSEPVLRVLDIGFGIGYNVMALLEAFLHDRRGRFLEVVSLEKNTDAISLLNFHSDDENRWKLFALMKKLSEKKHIRDEFFSVWLIEGDARVSVRSLPDSHFHAIFHDPYSPSKNPELWTVEFFREGYRVSKEGAVLTTYSSAPQIRTALLEAGFSVGKGPGMGKKREGTVASKGDVIMPLCREEIAALGLSKQSVPYRDPDMSSSMEDIIRRRKEEMRRFHS